MLKSVKRINEIAPELEPNELGKYMIDEITPPREIGEPSLKAVYAYTSLVLLKDYEKTYLTNRPKPGRSAGGCYNNAFIEWKTTGNRPVMVLELTIVSCKFYSLVPHACNIDKEGKLYDTDNFCSSGKKCVPRLVFIIRSPEKMCSWLTRFQTNPKSVSIPTVEFGDWCIITYKDYLWSIHLTKTTPGEDDSGESVKSIDTFSIKELNSLYSDDL